IGHNDTNFGIPNYDISGYWREDWRVVQPNFTVEYDLPIKGLTAKGLYSYYFANQIMNGHEYTYKVYDYDEENDEYIVTGGSSNPWREREYESVIENVLQGQLNYNNAFGKHVIGGTFVYERIQRNHTVQWQHAVPKTN